MIELNNQSNWTAGLFPAWSQQGEKQYTIVVKKVYEYNKEGKVVEASVTPELVMTDEYAGEPGESTVIWPSEIVPFKYGSEVIVTGKAFPPVAQPPLVMEATVGLQFPNGKHWSKSIMVIGERQWQSSLLGTVASDPSYLKPIDLIYEYAFGGKHPTNQQKVFAENPAGCGFELSGRVAKGHPLPQIETPGKLIRKAGQQVPPAGFAAIAPTWSPRLERNPDIDDDALVAGEFPYSSKTDIKLHNQAPEDQQLETWTDKTFTVQLKGLTSNLDYRKTLSLNLSLIQPDVALQSSEHAKHLKLLCDTLIIDTDQQTITQLWRGSVLEKALKQPSWITVLDGNDQEAIDQTDIEQADIEQEESVYA